MPITRFAPVAILTHPETGDQHLYAEGVMDRDPGAHAALMDWCAQVGIDPHQVLAGEPVIVSADRHTIRYTAFAKDDDGRVIPDPITLNATTTDKVLKLDEPAPPWPDAVLDVAEATPSTCPLCGHHTPARLPEEAR